MKFVKVITSLVITIVAFFAGTMATKLAAAYEVGSFSPDARWWYDSLGEHKENQVPFITAYKQGKAEAQSDVKQGNLKLKVGGWPSPPEVEEKRFSNIHQKYDIELNRITDCGITAKSQGYWLGYNEVMKSVIEQRYGAGFLEKISSEEN
ncbi:MAG: hypothetical protein HY231_24410 [Acidobacteria bacterium]|nr:hypothetical protein [Acidobacteriota bacterium]